MDEKPNPPVGILGAPVSKELLDRVYEHARTDGRGRLIRLPKGLWTSPGDTVIRFTSVAVQALVASGRAKYTAFTDFAGSKIGTEITIIQ